MSRNSFSNSGVSNSQGNSAYNGGPGSRIIDDDRLGGEHWWWLA